MYSGRYNTSRGVSTSQNPLLDLIEWMGFLKNNDFLIKLLSEKHNVDLPTAKLRTELIIPHIELAIDYLDESIKGKAGISFLNTYYGILNIIKVYILFGKYFAELSTNRHHGATYKVNTPQIDLLSDKIFIKPNGAIPLFYKTLTNETIKNDKEIYLSTILSFLPGIGYEYAIINDFDQRIAHLNFIREKIEEKEYIVAYVIRPDNYILNIDDLKILKGYSVHPTNKRRFIGPELTHGADFQTTINRSLNELLIYRSTNYTLTPISSDSLLFPQELAIVLFFFYMSNIVRYKPDFFVKLRTSIYWPMIAASQKHTLFEFLLNAWSFFQQENYFLNNYY
jgi:hypothetical protein